MRTLGILQSLLLASVLIFLATGSVFADAAKVCNDLDGVPKYTEMVLLLQPDGGFVACAGDTRQAFTPCQLCDAAAAKKYGTHCDKADNEKLVADGQLPICESTTRGTLRDARNIQIMKTKINPTCYTVISIGGKEYPVAYWCPKS